MYGCAKAAGAISQKDVHAVVTDERQIEFTIAIEMGVAILEQRPTMYKISELG